MANSILDDEEEETESVEEEIMLSQMYGFHDNVAIIYAANGGIVALCVLLLVAGEISSLAARGFSITAIIALVTFFLTYNVSFYLSSFGRRADREHVVQWLSVLTSLLTTLSGTLFGAMLIYVFFLPQPG